MKLLAAIALIGMTSTPALAGGPVFRGHRSVHYEEYCYKNVEKYHPGYFNKHGQWVGGYVDNKRKRVACGRRYMPQTSPNTFPRYEEEHPNVGSVDENSCIEGSILGGVVGGAMTGCQVDGG